MCKLSIDEILQLIIQICERHVLCVKRCLKLLGKKTIIIILINYIVNLKYEKYFIWNEMQEFLVDDSAKSPFVTFLLAAT